MPTAALATDQSPPWAPPIDLRRVARDIYGTTRVDRTGRQLWWATHTPDGPGTLLLERSGDGLARHAWGPGADWMLEQAPRVVGARDDHRSFHPPAGLVADLWRRRKGLVLGRTDRVFDATFEAVIGQKVQTALAGRTIRMLVAALGETAPGPASMRLYPSPQRLLDTGSAALHRFGLERKRGDTLLRVAAEAGRLEAAGQVGVDALTGRLRSIRGVGEWTAALVRTAALGDADAVAVGDYHLAHAVVYALTGRPRGSDAEMLELLEPFRPHRGRVVALLFQESGAAPRFGPRLELLPVDHFDRPATALRDRSPHGSARRAARR